MQSVTYIGNNPPVLEALSQYLAAQNIRLEAHLLPFKEELTTLTEAKVIILSSPMYFDGIYVSADGLWKNYLEYHHPEVLLLVAGFLEAKQSNYLDLLNLPEHFLSMLAQAKKAKENWLPLTTGGLNMEEKIRRFFEGHGDESLTDEFDKIFRILRIAGDELKNHQAGYEEVKNELLLMNKLPTKWKTLNNRWANYFPYFGSLPFFETFEQIEHWLRYIAPYFETGCEQETLFWQLNCLENIEKIKSNLTSISKHYVS